MMNIDCVIENINDLLKHYTTRDGFIFTSITEPANVFDAIVLRYPEFCDCHTPRVGISERTLRDCIDLINKFNIKKALVIAENIEFLNACPSLECIEVVPADTAGPSFDYSPIYVMPKIIEINCKTVYGNAEQFSTTIDYSKVKGLKRLSVCNVGHLNYSNVLTLESLRLFNLPNMKDLKQITTLCNLQSLDITQCSIQSLKGIESLTSLKQLYLGYCRTLYDMSDLVHIGNSLNQLSIENCHKIQDFDFLYQMTELYHLCLEGKNNLPSVCFLKHMVNLKELFLWMNVLDGDITPCMGISYVSLVNRKHYNMKDSDLSKIR